MSRREFTKSTRVAIIKRATVEGVTRCEKCFAAVTRFEVHHLKEDALEIDKSKPLTAVDGVLWCEPCHDEATRPFQTIIAKVKRVEARHVGATTPRGSIKSGPSKNKANRETPVEVAAGMSNIYRRFVGS